MSAEMLIAACNAPVYNTLGQYGFPEVVTDHELLITRATDAALDDLVKLIRSREDGENGVFGASLDDDQLDLFDEDHDSDAGIASQRRELALDVLKDVLSEVFPSIGGFGKGHPELSSEVTYMWVGIGDQKRTVLVTGGLSHGDAPTDVMPALTVLDMLNLFDEPFVRGNEPTDAMPALTVLDFLYPVDEPFVRPGAEAPAPAPARTLDTDELYALNDRITAQLGARGWTADTEEDYDSLNDLTHTIAEKQVSINELIEAFVAENGPRKV
jgi:hypothetical protein